jgi:Fe-S oxidoreductase
MIAMSRNMMKELEKVRRYIYNCRKCGVCSGKVTDKVPYVCPVKESTAGFDHFSSRGKTVIAQGLLEGAISPSQELAEIIYSCSLCGNCMTQCGSIDQDTGEPLVNTTLIVESMRADLLREHPEWIDRAYQTALKSTRQYGNPWGVPRRARGKWARELKLRDAKKEPAEVLLFTGCTIPSNPALVPRARKAAAILRKAGVDFAVLGEDEPCCGSVQRRIGDVDFAREIMGKNISLFNSLDCKAIVTLCAGCYHTLKKEYEQADTVLQPKVYHMVEFLARLIKEGKLTFTQKHTLKAAYHDPCHLGRHMEVFDPPREILTALPGVELVERAGTRENSICCGAGGGMRLFEGGSLAEEIGKASIHAAQQAGAEALVTACPFCEMNLEAAAQGLASPFPVYDIIDLVSVCIGVRKKSGESH